MISKKVIENINTFLADKKFSKVNQTNSWLRKNKEISHYISVNLTKGDNIRVIALAFLNTCDSSSIVLGGNLTQSSISGGSTIGGDYYWGSSTLDDLIKALTDVALPWFSILIDTDSYMTVKNSHLVEHSFGVPASVLRGEGSKIKDSELLETKYKALSKEDFSINILPIVNDKIKEFGFSLASNGEPFFIRKKNNIYDVVMFELINYGLHFGVYAYNWCDELAIDGSCTVNRDNSFMLNGGVISSTGVGVDSGKAFLLGDDENTLSSIDLFIDLFKRKTLPMFDSIQTKDDFRNSVKSEMRSMASSLLK